MAEKLRAVVVGCGGIVNAWLGTSTVHEEVEVVALVDLRREAAEQKAQQHGLSGALVTTDLDEALHKTRPQAVFNCTVPEAHCPVTLAALEHGCHVLTEKPLADTMANARRMVEAARAAGRILAVVQNRRYIPQVRALRSFVASGAVGGITTVQSNFFLGAHFGGFRDRMKHVLLLDMAIHTFDAARFITGADPAAVYCHEWNPAGSWYDHDAAALAVFEMTGGIVYVYQGSWCAEGCNTSWESEWRVVGENGSVLWDGGGALRAEAVAERGSFISKLRPLDVPVQPMPKSGHNGVIGEFVECVRSGRAPETAAEDNIKSLAMVFGAIESAEAGRRVAVEP